ncbi:thiosulfate oxidation carrier protein SoxY [Methylobacillus flagellatus]|uniref:Thiosulfate-binding protein SoxY n=1 Tax=Methylobacillus flagellatus (strain ATCC 51484 / DSM 6875 / VKM B-1610 / KT) TaxID=265072 RepID=Q1H4W5_METFK|nr:thiosulfate oxidation carrier protein SoxY [Methylobacillus flagellatus]ABE48472.1 thiosulfate-binding protein SoxY [Methylobacillus flagellatus KT]
MSAGRRTLLQWLAACCVMPWQALAASWRLPVMEPGLAESEMQEPDKLGDIQDSRIEIVAPALAEDGSSIRVDIMSRIQGTEAIALYASNNPESLIANFTFSRGAQPCVVTHIRLAQSQTIEVVVKAGSRYYRASRHIALTSAGMVRDAQG